MKRSGPFLEVVSSGLDAAVGDVEVERVLGAVRALADPEGVHRERASAALRAALPRVVSPTPLHTAHARSTASDVSESGGWFEVVVHAPPTSVAAAPSARGDAPLVAGVAWRRHAGLTPALLLGGALLGALGFWLGHELGMDAGRREARETIALVTGPAQPVERSVSCSAPESVVPVAPTALSVPARPAVPAPLAR